MIYRALLPYFWMLAGCLAFTFMGNFTFALSQVSGRVVPLDWQWIAFFRAALVFVFSLMIALSLRVPLVFVGTGSLWLRSISGSISLVCTFYAMTRLQLSLVLTITNMFPLWVACLSWPLLGKRTQRGEWLAIGFALVGVVVVQQPHASDNSLAMVAAVVSSISTSLAMIGLHKVKGMATQAIVVHFSGLATVVSFLFLPTAPSGFEGPIDSGWVGLVLILGIGLSATIGQTFLTLAFATGAPTRVAVVGLSQVVFALLGDIFFWKKIPTWGDGLGMALILLPTAWIMLREKRKASLDPG